MSFVKLQVYEGKMLWGKVVSPVIIKSCLLFTLKVSKAHLLFTLKVSKAAALSQAGQCAWTSEGQARSRGGCADS